MKRYMGMFGLFLLWFMAGYMLLAALWSNTYESIARSSHAWTFFQRVGEYFIHLNQNIGSLMFDVPFSLLPKGSLILGIFVGLSIGILFLLRIKRTSALVLLIAPIVLFIVSITFFLINTFTIESCIVRDTGCLWTRPITPVVFGILSLSFISLIPVSSHLRFSQKNNALIRSSMVGFIALSLITILWFGAIFLPTKWKEERSRVYSQAKTQERLAKRKQEMQLLAPTRLPHSLSRMTSEFEDNGVTQLYGCDGSTVAGLIIHQQPVGVGYGTTEMVFEEVEVQGVPGRYIVTEINGSVRQEIRFQTERTQVVMTLSEACRVPVSKDEFIDIARSMEKI